MGRKDERDLTRDVAGVGPYVRDGVRLVRLADMKGWKVADSDADIRGWSVRTISGRELGEVQDLLVDPEEGEVVLLDVDLKGGGRHTYAPARAAHIDRAARVVLVDTGDLRPDEDFPGLTRAGATDDEARTFSDRYSRMYGGRGWGRDRDYVVEDRGHDVHFRRRSSDAAATDVAAPIAAADAARRETAAGSAAVSAEGRTVRYPAHEETVVERRPVVVEEVVVRRRVVNDTAAASATPSESDSVSKTVLPLHTEPRDDVR